MEREWLAGTHAVRGEKQAWVTAKESDDDVGEERNSNSVTENLQGLTDAESQELQATHGLNEVEEHRESWIKMLLRHFVGLAPFVRRCSLMIGTWFNSCRYCWRRSLRQWRCASGLKQVNTIVQM
jgi:hypothetical protein